MQNIQNINRSWLTVMSFVSISLGSPVACAQEDFESQAKRGTWAFVAEEDAFTDDALLDLRSMNEARSGESGFVQLSDDGNSFVRGDGEAIRFWAVGSEIYKRSPEDMDRHCRFLAKIGVNMVRLHTNVAATKEGDEIDAVNEKEIAGVFRFIKAAKDNGIYLTISPYYGQHVAPKSWKLDGYSDEGAKPWGAIFIDERMQEAYKVWTKELYTRKNPHTALAISDDPTVAILQVHNEDSVFFWTFGSIPNVQKKKLGKRFGDWLASEHGSFEKAAARWKGAKAPLDDFENKIAAPLGPYHMTRDWDDGMAVRVRDETRFLAELQRAFYADMGKYLRGELKCNQLLNATNWRTANDLRLKEIERWTYAALDIDAENEYYGSDYQHSGENDGYRIDPGHKLVNESCLRKPLELTTNFKQQVGHPFIVTETSWKNPNLFQSEGPFLASAYQSLGGVDAVFWFSAQEVTWNLDPRRDFWKVGDSFAYHKWSCSNPLLMGMFPAAAVAFRNGYLKEGEPVIVERRSLEQLWNREPPLIDDDEIYGVSRETDECKTPKTKDGQLTRAAYLVGKVQCENSADVKPADRKMLLDKGAKQLRDNLLAEESTIKSNTGELTWNYDPGVCKVDAPKVQGVCGFLQEAGGHFKLADVTIDSGNHYASITVVSLDEKPINISQRILIQIGTTARLDGWKTKSIKFDYKDQRIAGLEIVNTGKPPWRVSNSDVHFGIRNSVLRHATSLDANGYRDNEDLIENNDGVVSFRVPKNAMYLILTSE